MALKFIYTNSRAAFFETLAITKEETYQRLRENPNWSLLEEIIIQLTAMQNFTANGRKPTFEERQSITYDRRVARELEGAPEDWYDYKKKLLELSMYFILWMTDKGLEEADPDDERFDFADDEDCSDEPDTP